MAELGSRLWGGGMRATWQGAGRRWGGGRENTAPIGSPRQLIGGGVAAGRGWARTLSPPGLAESPPPPSPG